MKIELTETWEQLLTELAEADAEFMSPANMMQTARTCRQLQAHMHSKGADIPQDVKELMQTYRAALTLCHQIWALQNQLALNSTSFMLAHQHPLKREKKKE